MPEEMTNQTSESTEIEGDLDIDFSDGEESSTSDTESEPVKADDFALDIRYNGENKRLSREEATTLAQKGMNYDKIYVQLQEAKSNPRYRAFEEQANELGITLEEYANRLTSFQEQSAKNEIAREFMADNPDATEDIAMRYAEEAYKNKRAERRANDEKTAIAKKNESDNAMRQQLEAFQKHYPNIDLKTLPTEVIDDINDGVPILQAYMLYENRELKNRLSANETNSRNRNRNVSGITDNAAASTGDPFLDGLLGK